MSWISEFRIRFATVSSKGLLLDDRIYSNRQMLESKWFEHASTEGPWKIPVLVSPTDQNHIILLNNDSLEIATTIEKQMGLNTVALQSYQNAICQLKELNNNINNWRSNDENS
jgi:hypothetical protein